MGAPDSPPHVQRAQGARTQGATRRGEVPRWAVGGGGGLTATGTRGGPLRAKHAMPGPAIVQADASGPPTAHHMDSGRRARAHREHRGAARCRAGHRAHWGTATSASQLLHAVEIAPEAGLLFGFAADHLQHKIHRGVRTLLRTHCSQKSGGLTDGLTVAGFPRGSGGRKNYDLAGFSRLTDENF